MKRITDNEICHECERQHVMIPQLISISAQNRTESSVIELRNCFQCGFGDIFGDSNKWNPQNILTLKWNTILICKLYCTANYFCCAFDVLFPQCLNTITDNANITNSYINYGFAVKYRITVLFVIIALPKLPLKRKWLLRYGQHLILFWHYMCKRN